METIHLDPKKSKILEEILLISKEDIKKAVSSIGWKIDEKGVIYTEKGDVAKCAICGDVLTVENLGTFFPGSIEAICTKFECYISEMEKIEKRLREPKKL